VQKELELQQKAQKVANAQARQDARDGVKDIAPSMR